MDIFDLSAKISLDTKDYEKGINSAQEGTSNFGNKLKSGLANAAKVATAALAATTAAVSAVAVSLTKGVESIAEYGDNIDKMSQKMGLSAEAYQEWDAIMQHSGIFISFVLAGEKFFTF